MHVNIVSLSLTDRVKSDHFPQAAGKRSFASRSIGSSRWKVLIFRFYIESRIPSDMVQVVQLWGGAILGGDGEKRGNICLIEIIELWVHEVHTKGGKQQQRLGRWG
jgi:hypothetical protein